jgi:hypothetical protein
MTAAGLNDIDRLGVAAEHGHGHRQAVVEVDLTQWRCIWRLRMLMKAPRSCPAFRDAGFAFRGTALTGSPKKRHRQ